MNGSCSLVSGSHERGVAASGSTTSDLLSITSIGVVGKGLLQKGTKAGRDENSIDAL